MNVELLQRLTSATSDEERHLIVLEFSLAALPEVVREAVQAAAIPHWFDALFLGALLHKENRAQFSEQNGFDVLITLNFVELVSGRGYKIHEQTRKLLLNKLWQENPERYRELSGRAADYCATQESESAIWLIERIYHLLLSDPDEGSRELRRLINEWQSFRQSAYGQVEQITRVALEHVEAGRLSGEGESWARLWQAKMGLLYNRPELTEAQLTLLDLPDKADPRLLAEIQRTWGDFYAQQGDEEAMTAAYQAALPHYEAANDMLEWLLIQEKIPREESSEAANASIQIPKEMSAARRQIIENIRTTWIDGVLKKSLSTVIDLELEKDSGQTDKAANWLLHRPEGIDRELPRNFSLSNLFLLSQQSMLILGAPGSGKTMTLLQLLEELLNMTLVDGEAPTPLFFNLSSWRKGSLLSWLENEAYNQYRLKKSYVGERLQRGRFTLLLDGLDEVPLTHRDNCVAAINEFLQENQSGVVICSRIADYEVLERQLQVHEAVVLQPLTNKQIDHFLQQGGARWEPLQKMVSDDQQLRELVRSPLLLNILTLAFQDLPPNELQTVDSLEQKRNLLFEQYVSTMFVRKPLTQAENYDQPKAIKWLAFFANALQKSGTSLFYIEEMQVQWLPARSYKRYHAFYGAIIGSISGLLIGLILGLSVGLSDGLDDGLNIGLIFGLTGALGGSVGTGLGTQWSSSLKSNWQRFVLSALTTWLLFGLISGLSGGLIFGLNGGLSGGLSRQLRDGLMIGLICGLGVGGGSGIVGSAKQIEMRERLQLVWPSLKRVWLFVKRGLLVGLSVGLSGVLGIGPLVGLSISLLDGLIIGLMGGLMGSLIGGTFLSLIDSPPVDDRPLAGQGISNSLRNAILMTAAIGLLLGLIGFGLDIGLRTYGFIFFLILANILPPVFTYYGGLAYMQHWTLRFMLWRQGSLPLRLIPFLDAMAERTLLRKVGGGYIFIHRSLLEYFASLYEPPE